MPHCANRLRQSIRIPLPTTLISTKPEPPIHDSFNSYDLREFTCIYLPSLLLTKQRYTHSQSFILALPQRRYKGWFFYTRISLFQTKNAYTHFQSFFLALQWKVVFLYAYIYLLWTKQRIYSLSGFYSGVSMAQSSHWQRKLAPLPAAVTPKPATLIAATKKTTAKTSGKP